MQKLSMRKLSILGLVLMAASAVTAAVIPSKSDKKDNGDAQKFLAGSLTQVSESPNGANAASSLTCDVDSVGSIGQACNYDTAGTGTTGASPDASSNDNASGDNGNTTTGS